MIRERLVVQSPFQALMALEARTALDLDPGDCELVVLWPGEPEAVRQTEAVVAAGQWPRVLGAPPRRRWPLAQAGFVRSIARQPAGRLFLGDPAAPLMTHLAAAQTAPVWVLDDGLGVERLCARRRRDDARNAALTGDDAPAGPQPRADRSRAMGRRLAGLQGPLPDRLTFFTMFDLVAGPHDTVVANELPALRGRVAERLVDPAWHLVLGGPMVELGWVDRSIYVDTVRHALDRLGPGAQYLPHRREDPGKVDELLAGRPDARCGLGGPIEWTLTGGDRLPAGVTSFFSTATYTLWRLLGDRVRFDVIDLGRAEHRPAHVGDVRSFLLAQTRGAVRVV